MQVLVLDKSPQRIDRCMLGFMEDGVRVMGTGTVAVADMFLRKGSVDLLVLSTEVAGAGTRALIRLAEGRNPGVATILLSVDVARAADIAAQTLPSVHCVLSADSPAQQVVQMGLSSLHPSEAPEAPAPSPLPDKAEPAVAEVVPEPEPVQREAVFVSVRRGGGLGGPTARAA